MTISSPKRSISSKMKSSSSLFRMGKHVKTMRKKLPRF